MALKDFYSENSSEVGGYDETGKFVNYDELVNGVQSGHTKESWHGSDAALHINNMISCKSYAASMASVALDICSHAFQELKKMLLTVEANGGAAVNIGSLKTTSFGESLKNGPEVVDTGGLYIDVEKASEALSLLKETYNDFFEFFERYSRQHGFIMEIWQSGGNHEFHNKTFQDFESQLGDIKEVFLDAIDSLGQAISNWSQTA